MYCDKRPHIEIAAGTGYSSTSGRITIELYANSDGSIEISYFDDGYPNPAAAGSWSREMPKKFIQNYDHKAFIDFLSSSILISRSTDEATVTNFLNLHAKI